MERLIPSAGVGRAAAHVRGSLTTISVVSPSTRSEDDHPKLISLPEMRYQTCYVLFIFVSSMDIMLTWLILSRAVPR